VETAKISSEFRDVVSRADLVASLPFAGSSESRDSALIVSRVPFCRRRFERERSRETLPRYSRFRFDERRYLYVIDTPAAIQPREGKPRRSFRLYRYHRRVGAFLYFLEPRNRPPLQMMSCLGVGNTKSPMARNLFLNVTRRSLYVLYTCLG